MRSYTSAKFAVTSTLPGDVSEAILVDMLTSALMAPTGLNQ